jgi:16S rRNA (guanine966-N2)-methyltransferase
LEALSRGAARCFFFERDPRALRALRANLRSLGVGAEASVLAVDAWTDGLRSVPAEHPVGLLVLDPPYRDARDASADGKLGRFLVDAARSGRLADDVVALVHHEASVRYADLPPHWVCVDRREYGTHGLSFFRLSSSESESCPE